MSRRVRLLSRKCRKCGEIKDISAFKTTKHAGLFKTCDTCRVERPWYVATAEEKVIFNALWLEAGAKKYQYKGYRHECTQPDPQILNWCYQLSDHHGLTCALADFPKWIAWEKAVNCDTWIYPCVVSHVAFKFTIRWIDRKGTKDD